MFRVIPAVDLKDGKVVRLRQGVEDQVTVEIENPIEIAKNWVERGAKVLHVIDLDGAFRGKLRHEDVILRIRDETNVEIQLGGGIRDLNLAKRLLDLGIDRIILGTLAVKRLEEVKAFANENPARVMIAIDTKRDRVVVEGWKSSTEFTPYDLARLYEGCEVSLLYTNVDVEGLVSGIDLGKIRDVVENTNLPVFVAGGITTREDVVRVKKTGAVGVVIGSAFYTGKLRFEEVRDLEE